MTDKRIEIRGNDVDNNYLELFAKYSMGLMFNYTPELYDDQISDLLKLTSPGYFNAMNKRLKELKDDVISLSITSVFYPQILKVNKETNTIRVYGLKIQSAAGKEIERGNKIYVLKYQIIDGRFYVDSVEESNTK